MKLQRVVDRVGTGMSRIDGLIVDWQIAEKTLLSRQVTNTAKKAKLL
ncbi:MAG: hypothetical protein KJ063_24605 [Anaerolineae bacterium]|nr:hypothetical protein [Anaerolineae bacterium]